MQATEAALTLCPHHAYAHYLYGIAIYRTIELSWTGQRPLLEPDTCIEWLSRAVEHLKKATADPSLTGPAEVLSVVTEALVTMRSLKATIERQIEEGRSVVDLYARRGEVFALVGEGIVSLEHFAQVRSQLQDVSRDARALLKEVKSEQAQADLRALVEGLAKNLEELTALEPAVRESDAVGDLYRELGQVLQQAEGGIRDETHLRSVSEPLEKLARDAANLKKRLKHTHAREALDDLMATLGEHRKQLDNVSAQARQNEDMELLEPEFVAFKAVMKQFEQRRVDRDTFYMVLSGIAERVDEKQSFLQSPEAREAVTRLKATIKRYLDELDRRR
jgi:hypothetical protein